MLSWIIAGLVWWLWSWKGAACVMGAALAVRCVWTIAKIGNTRIRANRLIEMNRLRDAEIVDIVNALYREEMGRKCL